MTKPHALQIAFDVKEIKKRLEDRLGDKAGTFVATVLDLYAEDKNLALCDPHMIIKEALKAAALDLPVNKNLGFAYVIPYKTGKVMIPHFQMGWKGYVQLAIRSGQYKHLNTGVIFEGETVVEDRIRGTLKIEGEKKNDNAIGFFCYMQLLNGFEKALFWSKDKAAAHGKKYSKSYNSSYSVWKTDFNAMALKTMFLQLVPKYGPLTVDMNTALLSDRGDLIPFKKLPILPEEKRKAIDITPEKIDIKMPPSEQEEFSEQEQAEIRKQELKENESEQQPNF